MNNQISVAPLYEDYLAHHQIKGAKWGVMHGPPYPLSRGKGGKLPTVKKVTSEAKKRREEKKAQKAESRAEEKKEQLRKYIVEHPNTLYKHKDMFSRSELEDILKEIDFDQKLKDVNRNQFKKTIDTVKDVATLTISMKNIASGAVDLYKSGKDIQNILKGKGAFKSDSDKKESSNDSKKADKKADQKTESAKKESKSSESSGSGDLNPELKKMLGIK